MPLLKFGALVRRSPAFADGILLVPIAALVALLPRLLHGPSCGHDFDFHLVSWMEVQRSWSEGVVYPHWAQSPNWSAGEARFVFYPPLSWIAGALLGYVLSWDHASAFLTYLCFLGTGLSTRALARQFLPAANATLAGAIATCTPYALFTAYERTAFGELAAATFIPLLLLYALRPPTKASGVSYSLFPIPCSLLLALCWLTNAPAGVMASYLLAFTALVAAILHRAWWPILRAAFAAFFGLALAAFYLVPAAYEQRWIAIQQAVDVGMRISDSWLFARHASPDLALHDEVLRSASWIIVVTATLALAAFVLTRRKLTKESRAFWLPLAILIPAIVLLQFPVSAFLWHLPRLEFLQFPWRWLVVLGVPFSVFLAAATPLTTRRARWIAGIAWTAILLASAAVTMHFFMQPCDDEDRASNQAEVFRAETGVAGTDEYAVTGSDNSLVADELPDACLVSDASQTLGQSDTTADGQLAPVWYEEQGSCDDTFDSDLSQNEHKTFAIDSDHEGFIVLRLRRYPAWQITLNGKPATSLIREDGLIALPIPAGPSQIDIRWTTTPDQRLGRAISAAALIVLILLWLYGRRRNRSRTIIATP